MKQFKSNTDASHLTYICKWDHWWGDWRLLFCLLQWLCPVRSVSGNDTKHFTARRLEETICFSRAWSIRSSLFHYLWLEAGGYFLSMMSIFCVYGWTGIVQVSGVFLSFSFQTNAHTWQDLTRSRPATINTKWKFLQGAFNLFHWIYLTEYSFRLV